MSMCFTPDSNSVTNLHLYSMIASIYHRPTFKCEDAINANFFSPDSQLLETQLQYYVRGDESRWAQNAIIEFAISLKMRKHNLFTTGLLSQGGMYVLYECTSVYTYTMFIQFQKC